MSRTKRAALYLRVSTDGQTTDNQRLALEAVATQRGWSVVATYEDAGISGAKGRDKRPGLDKLLQDAARARFDVVMAWALDRLGRSLADLIGTLTVVGGRACRSVPAPAGHRHHDTSGPHVLPRHRGLRRV